MKQPLTLKLEAVGTEASGKSNPVRLFYTVAALVMLVITLIGFQQFYLHGKAVGNREIPPRMFWLTVVHGVAMSAWILLFLVQPLLIVSGNRRQHIMLGRMGTVLAGAIVIIGVTMAIESVRVTPDDGVIGGLTRKQFLAIPLTDITKFAFFVAIGVIYRRHAEIHRPMMLLATLTAITASAARIHVLRAFYAGTYLEYWFGPLVPVLMIGLLFLIVHLLLTRKLDRYYAMGYGGLVITTPLIMSLARSGGWGQVSEFLTR